MRPLLTALVLSLGLSNVALADVEVGPPPVDAAETPDAHASPDAATTSSRGEGRSATAGTGVTEGALVLVTLGAVGLASAFARRRARH